MIRYSTNWMGPINGEDWLELGKFCDDMKTDVVLSSEDFWEKFEKFLGREVRWWRETDRVLDYPIN